MLNYFHIVGSLFFCVGAGSLLSISIALSKIEKHLAAMASQRSMGDKDPE
ncbi:hypothetical protein [Stieleria marina]|uniref:Uncharacterized protein n=1 Tax=Stieleria marina TaxID=1930275 RepID=A0A517NV71_9BACT|nr:hypothetical protein K239x_30050 [Planctomycetes bacterium K23_9]